MEPARIFPERWREKLIAASKVEDDFERRKAIDDVMVRLAWEYPRAFRRASDPIIPMETLKRKFEK